MDTEGISIYDKTRLLEITIDDIVKYHGGLCPGIAVGFKATKFAAMSLWGDEIPKRDDFLIIITNKLPKCAVDALEFITRAKTRGNLIIENTDKERMDWSFTFARKSEKTALNVKLRQNAPKQRLPKMDRDEFTGFVMRSKIGDLFDFETAPYDGKNDEPNRPL